MGRLKSTPLALLAAAGCPLAGCTGQNVEGRWRGSFPLEGSRSCEVRLLEDRAATVQCDGTAVVGAGHYRWDGAVLSLDLPLLTYDGHKVRPPGPFSFAIRGEGNTLRAERDGRLYVWHRTMR